MREISYIKQPTEYLCGQTCVAMIANASVDDVIRVMGTDKGTGKKDIEKLYSKARIQSYLELYEE